MRQIGKLAIQSTFGKIDSLKIDNSFEVFKYIQLFGLDFMLDTDFNCWLIEANTNPCIEETSKLLEMLIPRMIDDMFKLTIDPIFSPFPVVTGQSVLSPNSSQLK